MAGRRSPVTDIREILRRLQLGERARRIARDLEVSRNTVAHYQRWATPARPADESLARAVGAGRVAGRAACEAAGPGAVPRRTLRRPSVGLARSGRRGPGDLAAPRGAARLRRELFVDQAVPPPCRAAHAARDAAPRGRSRRGSPGGLRLRRPVPG
jgi:hypothetical protein